MAKRKYDITSQKNKKWIKEGRGQGRGLEFKPLITVFDISSKGLAGLPTGLIIERIYHVISTHETKYLKSLEMTQYLPSPLKIIDIREQVALLPQDETLAIADKLGYKHPNVDRVNIIMSTDFVITILKDGSKIDVARTIKETRDLAQRTLEKLEIERIYWERRDIDWGIVTESELDSPYTNNAVDLWDDVRLVDKPVNAEDIELIAPELSQGIMTTSKPLNKYCLMVDKQLGYKNGTSLTVARHLIATGHWQIDWNTEFVTTNSLIVKSVKSYMKPNV